VLRANFYAGPEWTVSNTDLTQAQINAKKMAINGHFGQSGCDGWNDAFGFHNMPANYLHAQVLDQTTGALASGVDSHASTVSSDCTVTAAACGT
jgi:hypothetical protein